MAKQQQKIQTAGSDMSQLAVSVHRYERVCGSRSRSIARATMAHYGNSKGKGNYGR